MSLVTVWQQQNDMQIVHKAKKKTPLLSVFLIIEQVLWHAESNDHKSVQSFVNMLTTVWQC